MDNDYIEVEVDDDLWIVEGHLCTPIVKSHGKGAPGFMTVPVVVLKAGTKLKVKVVRG